MNECLLLSLEALPQTQTTTELPAPSTEDSPSTVSIPREDSSSLQGDSRLDFLRALLSKIRESAEKAGVEGTMQVSLVQVDPPASMPERESLSVSPSQPFYHVAAIAARRFRRGSPARDERAQLSSRFWTLA